MSKQRQVAGRKARVHTGESAPLAGGAPGRKREPARLAITIATAASVAAGGFSGTSSITLLTALGAAGFAAVKPGKAQARGLGGPPEEDVCTIHEDGTITGPWWCPPPSPEEPPPPPPPPPPP